jgi:chemotaxis protein histidine kinase CheA
MGLRSDADRTPGSLQVRNRDQIRTVPLTELDALIECPPLTSVPAAPEWLLGVAAYDGALLSVIDLGAACGDRGPAAREPGERLLLVETGVHRLAFSVDEILSQAVDSTPNDGSVIALRLLAKQLLGAAPAVSHGMKVETTAP